ncbi:hypothetical protein [Paenibacillus sp. LHD-38]|uniref:hypothetical protein n=1 Tax=Paenibacillus sp. LHD-38 TaxID=3072143 RepID=UPI00280F2015|nr:hypothetical protein [Paenibacillus sp. LHD-38]MDQ8733864.1 hypothetical protein [Paenibacillus sp. LHD-38]
MNVAKFHYVIQTIRNDLKKCNLEQLFNQLRNSLANSLAQPNSSNSEQFKEFLQNFKEATDACKSNSFTVSEYQILNEIKGTQLVGQGLYDNVLHHLSTNNLTPGDAINELNLLSTQLTKFQTTIESIDSSFNDLEIEYDYLENNEYEIGYLVPREITDNTIKGLVHEFKSLDDLLITFKEIVSEDIASTRIRTISNSAFQVFLESTPAVIGITIASVERIIALIKTVLETKQIYDNMKSRSMPNEVTEPMKAYIDNSISQGIGNLAKELIQEYYQKTDQGRANELEVILKKHLNYLADRLDKGATIEVKVGTPNEDEDIEVESVNNEQLHLKVEQFKKITYESVTSSKHILKLQQYTDEQ